eukprot:7294958-Alexandrium_andersonii.AAC.1
MSPHPLRLRHARRGPGRQTTPDAGGRCSTLSQRLRDRQTDRHTHAHTHTRIVLGESTGEWHIHACKHNRDVRAHSQTRTYCK